MIPIIIGDDDLTFMTWKLLFENGGRVCESSYFPAVAPRTAAAAHQLYGNPHR